LIGPPPAADERHQEQKTVRAGLAKLESQPEQNVLN
jgi:hypothetical protein